MKIMKTFLFGAIDYLFSILYGMVVGAPTVIPYYMITIKFDQLPDIDLFIYTTFILFVVSIIKMTIEIVKYINDNKLSYVKRYGR